MSESRDGAPGAFWCRRNDRYGVAARRVIVVFDGAALLAILLVGIAPASADITVQTSAATALAGAVLDADGDGTLQDDEKDTPPLVTGSANAFDQNIVSHTGGAVASAIEHSIVTNGGSTLTITASGDCDGRTPLTGNHTRDLNRAAGGQMSILVDFHLAKPGTFSYSGNVSVTPQSPPLSTGGGGDNRSLLSFAGSSGTFVDIEADDASLDPNSDSTAIAGEIPAGEYAAAAQIQCFGPRRLAGEAAQPEGTGHFSFSLTVSEGQCAGPTSRWVGPDTGSFDDPNNWDPPEVPSFGSGDGECEDGLFDRHRMYTIDLSAPAAASALALAPRAAGSRTAGRLAIRKARQVEFVNGVLFLNSGDVDDHASLVVGDGGLAHVFNGTLQARHALIGDHGLGTVGVDGAGSFFKTLDTLTIGGTSGDGVLSVTDKGEVDSALVRIGGGASHGSAKVSNATWHTEDMFVGFKSPGELTIENGGEVDSADAFVDVDLPPAPVPPLGNNAPCLGRAGAAGVEVRGSHSVWNVANLDVRGLGCVEVTDEAGIVAGQQSNGNVGIGADDGDDATLLVNRAGVVIAGGSLVVGNGGRGRVVLTENIDQDPRITVGGTLVVGGINDDAEGSVVVDGDPQTSGNSLTSNDVRVPDVGTAHGVLRLNAGARILTRATAEIGADTEANGSTSGTGIVFLRGASPAQPDLTRWTIGESLTIGPTTLGGGLGTLSIKDATVAVGVPPAHGAVTIRAGGIVSGGADGTNNNLITNGGTIHNDGVVFAPIFLGGTYDGSGTIVQQIANPPPVPAPASAASLPATTRGGAATSAVLDATPRAAKPFLPQGPVVVDGDADLSGTTLVLQFLNGFAPHQGDTLPIFDVHGQRTGNFTHVEIRGLAPGAAFDLTTQPGTATALTDAVALPVVAIKAPAKLKESAKSGAKVKLKRSGPTDAPLTVHYSVGGSATNGIDYVELPGTVVIPAKKSSAALVVQPFADGIPEAPETIALEVLPGDDYAPSLPTSATITLLSTEKKAKSK